MKMRATLCLAGIAALTTPAFAQDSGTLIKRYDQARISDWAKVTPADRARLAISSYATCLVKASPKRVRAVLDMPPFNQAYSTAIQKLAIADCLSAGEMRFSDQMFRGALFEASYRRDYGRSETSLRATPLNFLAALGPQSSSQDRSDAGLRQFADCVVRRNIAVSRTFVLSLPVSQGEQGAIAPLSPELSLCMPKGVQVRFGSSMLKGLLAEALYREAEGAEPAPTETAGTNP